jgi:hypothetical protein
MTRLFSDKEWEVMAINFSSSLEDSLVRCHSFNLIWRTFLSFKRWRLFSNNVNSVYRNRCVLWKTKLTIIEISKYYSTFFFVVWRGSIYSLIFANVILIHWNDRLMYQKQHYAFISRKIKSDSWKWVAISR